ncbi:MAG: MFS transporter, partial [Yaniella sp.]|nr:MFS transporter [Yaniella sp.]
MKAQTQAPLRRIFNNKHRCNTIVLSLAWILVWMGIQTFSVLGTTILESRKGVDASSALMIVVVANIVGA